MAVYRGMERNSRNYKWAYQSLEKFAGSNDIKFSQLTTKFSRLDEDIREDK